MAKARWIHLDGSLCHGGPVDYADECGEHGRTVRLRRTRRELEERVAELEARVTSLRSERDRIAVRCAAALNAVEAIAQTVHNQRLIIVGSK